jgi:hypothetical protein
MEFEEEEVNYLISLKESDGIFYLIRIDLDRNLRYVHRQLKKILLQEFSNHILQQQLVDIVL